MNSLNAPDVMLGAGFVGLFTAVSLAVAIAQINAAISVLNNRATPNEIQEYKEFIYSCCDGVAKAAGSGLLGTGQKVSAGEAKALEKLKMALSL